MKTQKSHERQLLGPSEPPVAPAYNITEEGTHEKG
jgi:hypothetical protein